MMMKISPYKSYLFVPATRLDRVTKAVQSGAHAIIIDLEDATPKDKKTEARQMLFEFLSDWDWQNFPHIWLRINNDADNADAEFLADVTLLNQHPKLCGVLLPKLNTKTELTRLSSVYHGKIIGVIESATGLLNLSEIAKTEQLYAISYGCLDLMTSMGISLGTNACDIMMQRVRSDIILHSAANGLHAPIETIFPDFKDIAGLQDYAEHWQNFGFGGQLLIHPAQVAVINALKPSKAQLDFAQKIINHITKNPHDAVFSIDGQMVDLPVINWAKSIIAQV